MIYLGNNNENCVFETLDDVQNIVAVGAPGSGKSVFLHSNINHILKKYSSNDLLLCLIDTKCVEFYKYEKYVNNLFTPIAHTNKEIHKMLDTLLDETNRRLASKKTKPAILVLCDEFLDTPWDDKKLEQKVLDIMKNSKETKIYFFLMSQLNRFPDSIYKEAETRINFYSFFEDDILPCFNEKETNTLNKPGDLIVKNKYLFNGQANFLHIDIKILKGIDD